MKLYDQKINHIISGFTVGFLAVLAVFATLTMTPIRGLARTYIVMSGSMEPVIKTGSIVAVSKDPEYKVGDVITFKTPKNENSTLAQATTTHRIVDIGQVESGPIYIVKGDANESPDSQPVMPDDVIGKVRYTIPFIGYALSFGRTTPGFILFIVIPATIIIYHEFLSLTEEIKKLIRRKGLTENNPV